ncbi:MAG: hypothetical protein ACYCVB_17290 [Bacilli bacterium]
MVFELILWNISKYVRRKRFAFVLLFMLVFEIASYYPPAGIFYTFGYVNSLVVFQLALLFVVICPVFESGSVHFLMRLKTRRSFWAARVLSTVIYLYGTVILLSAAGMVLMTVMHGTIFTSSSVHFPSINRLNSHGAQNVLLTLNLLSLGIVSAVILMDVLQLLLNNIVASYMIVVAFVLVSTLSYLVPAEPLSHIVFLISPFLRMSLVANLRYHTAPFNSILYFFFLSCAGSILGRLLFIRKELMR